MTGNVHCYGQPGLLTNGWEKDSSQHASRQELQEQFRREAMQNGTYGKPVPSSGAKPLKADLGLKGLHRK